MNLSVTTIRHNLTKVQLADIMTQYQTDPKLMERIDIDRLAKSGVSKVDIVENGVKITTVVEITGN